MRTLLRRILVCALALSPLVGEADACTLAALAGRSDLACDMEKATRHAAAVAAETDGGCPACHGGDAAPADEARSAAPGGRTRSSAPTCCDLKPQAAPAETAPQAGAPVTSAHAALAPALPTPAVPVACGSRIASDEGRAPPGRIPAPLTSRAPPRA